VRGNVLDSYGGNIYAVAFGTNYGDIVSMSVDKRTIIETFIYDNIMSLDTGVMQLNTTTNQMLSFPIKSEQTMSGDISKVYTDVTDTVSYVISDDITDYYVYILAINVLGLRTSAYGGGGNAYAFLPHENFISNFVTSLSTIDNTLTVNADIFYQGNVLDVYAVAFADINTNTATAQNLIDTDKLNTAIVKLNPINVNKTIDITITNVVGLTYANILSVQDVLSVKVFLFATDLERSDTESNINTTFVGGVTVDTQTNVHTSEYITGRISDASFLSGVLEISGTLLDSTNKLTEYYVGAFTANLLENSDEITLKQFLLSHTANILAGTTVDPLTLETFQNVSLTTVYNNISDETDLVTIDADTAYDFYLYGVNEINGNVLVSVVAKDVPTVVTTNTTISTAVYVDLVMDKANYENNKVYAVAFRTDYGILDQQDANVSSIFNFVLENAGVESYDDGIKELVYENVNAYGVLSGCFEDLSSTVSGSLIKDSDYSVYIVSQHGINKTSRTVYRAMRGIVPKISVSGQINTGSVQIENGNVYIGTDVSLPVDFALSVWTYPSVTGTSWVVGLEDGDNTKVIKINGDTNDVMWRSSTKDVGSSEYTISSPALLNGGVILGQWNHFVICSNVDGISSSYVNGVLVDPTSDIVVTGTIYGQFDFATTRLTVGAGWENAGDADIGRYYGQLDDLVLFSGHVTQSEVDLLYGGGFPYINPNTISYSTVGTTVVAYYPFDINFDDASLNGNDLQPVFPSGTGDPVITNDNLLNGLSTNPKTSSSDANNTEVDTTDIDNTNNWYAYVFSGIASPQAQVGSALQNGDTVYSGSLDSVTSRAYNMFQPYTTGVTGDKWVNATIDSPARFLYSFGNDRKVDVTTINMKSTVTTTDVRFVGNVSVQAWDEDTSAFVVIASKTGHDFTLDNELTFFGNSEILVNKPYSHFLVELEYTSGNGVTFGLDRFEMFGIEHPSVRDVITNVNDPEVFAVTAQVQAHDFAETNWYAVAFTSIQTETDVYTFLDSKSYAYDGVIHVSSSPVANGVLETVTFSLGNVVDLHMQANGLDYAAVRYVNAAYVYVVAIDTVTGSKSSVAVKHIFPIEDNGLRLYMPFDGDYENKVTGTVDVNVTSSIVNVDINNPSIAGSSVYMVSSTDYTSGHIRTKTTYLTEHVITARTAWTISMWVKFDSFGTNVYLWGVADAYGKGWFIQHTGGRFDFNGMSSGSSASAFGMTNTWYHVVYIHNFNGSTSNDSVYINNQLYTNQNNVDIGGPNPIYSSSVMGIGNNYVTSSHTMFNGHMDEFRIYDRALSVEEVSNLYLWRASTVSSIHSSVFKTVPYIEYDEIMVPDVSVFSSTANVDVCYITAFISDLITDKTDVELYNFVANLDADVLFAGVRSYEKVDKYDIKLLGDVAVNQAFTEFTSANIDTLDPIFIESTYTVVFVAVDDIGGYTVAKYADVMSNPNTPGVISILSSTLDDYTTNEHVYSFILGEMVATSGISENTEVFAVIFTQDMYAKHAGDLDAMNAEVRSMMLTPIATLAPGTTLQKQSFSIVKAYDANDVEVDLHTVHDTHLYVWASDGSGYSSVLRHATKDNIVYSSIKSVAISEGALVYIDANDTESSAHTGESSTVTNFYNLVDGTELTSNGTITYESVTGDVVSSGFKNTSTSGNTRIRLLESTDLYTNGFDLFIVYRKSGSDGNGRLVQPGSGHGHFHIEPNGPTGYMRAHTDSPDSIISRTLVVDDYTVLSFHAPASNSRTDTYYQFNDEPANSAGAFTKNPTTVVNIQDIYLFNDNVFTSQSFTGTLHMCMIFDKELESDTRTQIMNALLNRYRGTGLPSTLYSP
jgi:hypothetical protein